jgi:hypothetical protein
MSHIYDIELTDIFGGEANYSWARRASVSMPELDHFGYTGSADGSYSRTNRIANRELMRKAKAAMGLTGIRGRVEHYGDSIEFRPYGMCQVMFITFREGE